MRKIHRQKALANPPKDLPVLCWWESLGRWTKAKWTGKRWLRFNDLFGGYDPVEPPKEWKHFEDT